MEVSSFAAGEPVHVDSIIIATDGGVHEETLPQQPAPLHDEQPLPTAVGKKAQRSYLSSSSTHFLMPNMSARSINASSINNCSTTSFFNSSNQLISFEAPSEVGGSVRGSNSILGAGGSTSRPCIMLDMSTSIPQRVFSNRCRSCPLEDDVSPPDDHPLALEDGLVPTTTLGTSTASTMDDDALFCTFRSLTPRMQMEHLVIAVDTPGVITHDVAELSPFRSGRGGEKEVKEDDEDKAILETTVGPSNCFSGVRIPSREGSLQECSHERITVPSMSHSGCSNSADDDEDNESEEDLELDRPVRRETKTFANSFLFGPLQPPHLEQ